MWWLIGEGFPDRCSYIYICPPTQEQVDQISPMPGYAQRNQAMIYRCPSSKALFIDPGCGITSGPVLQEQLHDGYTFVTERGGAQHAIVHRGSRIEQQSLRPRFFRYSLRIRGVDAMDRMLIDWLQLQSAKPYAIPDPMQVELRRRRETSRG